MTTILVLGGSAAGLSVALMLARAGHEVTVLERDGRPAPRSPEEASTWERPTVPQYQQAHGLNAAGRRVLATRLPDVLEELRRRGVQEFSLADFLPPSALGGDTITSEQTDDLVSIGLRRSLLEWVLGQAAERQPGLHLRRGEVATEAIWDFERAPRVVGVRTRRGAVYADLVVDATGRRSRLTQWARAAGITVPELDLDCEFVAQSRFFRIRNRRQAPPLLQGNATVLPLDGCNVYAFPGDNHTVAIAIGRHPQDQALSAVRMPDAFDAAVAAVPFLAGFVRPDVAEPLSGVHVMAGIRATFRRLAPQGRPLFHGLIPIGDALATTNPAYGRGLALALMHAEVVADAVGDVGATRASSAPVLAAWVLPGLDALTLPVWYDAYRHDGMRIDQWRRTLGLPEVARSESAPWLPLSVAAATARVDAQVFIRMLRAMQLLDRPDQFFGDLDLIERLPGVGGAPMPLPTRADLVAAVEGDPLQAAG